MYLIVSDGSHIILSQWRKAAGQIFMSDCSHGESAISLACALNEIHNATSRGGEPIPDMNFQGRKDFVMLLLAHLTIEKTLQLTDILPVEHPRTTR